MKVAVYTICKNESKHVDRFMDSCEGADYVVILDTGSDDDSVERLRERGAIVTQMLIEPWRFDDARNRNLELVPDDVDICFSIDLDETLGDGWRQELDSKWCPGITRVNYWYRLNDGEPYRHHKAHSRQGYRWKYMVHEELFATIHENECWTDILVTHDPDPLKDRSTYRFLLECSIRECRQNYRAKMYYIIELFNENRVDEAISLIEHCLEEGDLWEYDRSYLCMLASDSGVIDANLWAMRAVIEAPDWRDAWYNCAKFFNKQGDYSIANRAINKAFNLTDRWNLSYSNPEAWNAHIYKLAMVLCSKVGDSSQLDNLYSYAVSKYSDDSINKLYLEIKS